MADTNQNQANSTPSGAESVNPLSLCSCLPTNSKASTLEGFFMVDKNYLLLHRKLENWIFFDKDSDILKIWLWLLIKANYWEKSKKTYLFNGAGVRLKPGQLITSRATIGKETGIQQSKVERILKKLKSEQQIEQQSSNASRLISIVNWKKYQFAEQQSEHQVNSDRTTGEQRVNTHKQINKVNKVKKININIKFLEAYKIYPGNKSKTRDWNCFIKHKDWEESLSLLKPAIEREIEHKKYLKSKGTFCYEWAFFSTWLNQRRWEQELEKKESGFDPNFKNLF
jgi:hypothetical protein